MEAVSPAGSPQDFFPRNDQAVTPSGRTGTRVEARTGRRIEGCGGFVNRSGAFGVVAADEARAVRFGFGVALLWP